MIVHETGETDTQLLARAVKDLARRTRFPIAFGGLEREGDVRITTIVGTRTHSIDGLCVRQDRGLGGRAMRELRPRMTADYKSARHITHDYDGHVLGEGISTLLAVPVIVGGRARAVLYGGAWENSSVGDIVAGAAFQVGEQLGTELRIRDEVRRRVTEMRAVTTEASPAGLTPAHREELRESYAELRSIASGIDDPGVRERLQLIEKRLGALAGDEAVALEGLPDVHLSPRETDVLACAALGSTNAQIAASLGLREGTVKAYLGSAMSKLDASTRHAAVARARRAGILP